MQTEVTAPQPMPKTERAQKIQDRGPMARDLLIELFRHLGLEAEVTLHDGGEDISLHAKLGEGAEAAGLAGPRPTMQEPLAYLLSKMVNRGLAEGGPRAFVRLSFGDAPPAEASKGVVVPLAEETDPDVMELGRMLAQRAKTLGKTLTVGPMTARERRSIHVAVKEAGGATTRSEGEGLLRRVLIVPEGPHAALPTPEVGNGLASGGK